MPLTAMQELNKSTLSVQAELLQNAGSQLMVIEQIANSMEKHAPMGESVMGLISKLQNTLVAMFDLAEVQFPDRPFTNSEVSGWVEEMNDQIALVQEWLTGITGPLLTVWYANSHSSMDYASFLSNSRTTNVQVAGAAKQLKLLKKTFPTPSDLMSPGDQAKAYLAPKIEKAIRMVEEFDPNKVIKSERASISYYIDQDVESTTTPTINIGWMDGFSGTHAVLDTGSVPYITGNDSLLEFVTTGVSGGIPQIGAANITAIANYGSNLISISTSLAINNTLTAVANVRDYAVWKINDVENRETKFCANVGFDHFLGLVDGGPPTLAAAYEQTKIKVSVQVILSRNGIESNLTPVQQFFLNDNSKQFLFPVELVFKFLPGDLIVVRNAAPFSFTQSVPVLHGDCFQVQPLPALMESKRLVEDDGTPELKYWEKGEVVTMAPDAPWSVMFNRAQKYTINPPSRDFINYTLSLATQYGQVLARTWSALLNYLQDAHPSVYSAFLAKYTTILGGTPDEGLPTYLANPLSWFIEDLNLRPGSYSKFYAEVLYDLVFFNDVFAIDAGLREDVARSIFE
jgi:hypothetical protein